MASRRQNPFHDHGDQGTQPDSGLDFQTGGNPKAPEFDFFWYHVIQKIKDFIIEFNRLDSNDDGVVDEADYANDADASTYKGNDIDSDGNGKPDTAEYAEDANASTYKGNDIDSDGSGAVDEAETVSGNDGAAHFAGSLPVYANTTEGLNNTSTGDLWYNEADGEIYYNRDSNDVTV
jgi:hypothetical protein